MSNIFTICTYNSSHTDEKGVTYDSYNTEEIDVTNGISYTHTNEWVTLTIQGRGDQCKFTFVSLHEKSLCGTSGIDVRHRIMYVKKRNAQLLDMNEKNTYLNLSV